MKSIFGDRDTVGKIYVDTQKNSAQGLVLGDINAGIVPDFIEDINTTLQNCSHNDRPFYVAVTEKRDSRMKNLFHRFNYSTLYRPFPEHSTFVLYKVPKDDQVYFCWDIPHRSEMVNILSNEDQYPKEYIQDIRNWLKGDFRKFGWMRVNLSNENVEGYKKKTIDSYRSFYIEYCKEMGMSSADLEKEKKHGNFWLPVKNYPYPCVTSGNTKKFLDVY